MNRTARNPSISKAVPEYVRSSSLEELGRRRAVLNRNITQKRFCAFRPKPEGKAWTEQVREASRGLCRIGHWERIEETQR